MSTGERIIPINIEDEMKSAYIDYSMSVIVSRALPDVRDGLKPVHRRALFGMNDLGMLHNRGYKKSARIVGEAVVYKGTVVVEVACVDNCAGIDDAARSEKIHRSRACLKIASVFDMAIEVNAPQALILYNARIYRLRASIIVEFARTVIHKITHVVEQSGGAIEEGTVVFAGAIIQPNSKIGKHVIINTGASIDHDNIIGDYAHVSPKAALCGHVEVGEGSHVGVGAVVIPKVKIGKWCTIGAGTVVLKDVPDYATVVGNPAKIIKYNKPE